MVLEQYTFGRQPVDRGTRISTIPVTMQMVRSQRINRDQDNVGS